MHLDKKCTQIFRQKTGREETTNQ